MSLLDEMERQAIAAAASEAKEMDDDDDSDERGIIFDGSADLYEYEDADLLQKELDEEVEEGEELDNPTPLEYSWTQTTLGGSSVLEDMDDSGIRQFMASYAVSDYSPRSSFSESAADMTMASGLMEDDSMRTSNTEDIATPRLNPRRSFTGPPTSESSSGEFPQLRRSSRVSFASAPARTGEASSPRPVTPTQRRLTISVPNDARLAQQGSDDVGSDDGDWRRSSRRRRSVKVNGNSITAGSDISSSTRGSGSSNSSRRNQLSSSLPFVLQSIRAKTVSFRGKFDRRHTQQLNQQDHSNSAPPTNATIDGKRVAFSSLDNAVSALADQSASQWQNVAAAAAVVAASAYKRSTNNLYDVDAKVLVLMTLLNVTNKVDSKDALTVCPVNRFGFAAGEGKTEEERSGPFNYVLCTVKKAHFDEDDRYYTVIRADTGSEQRADSGKWSLVTTTCLPLVYVPKNDTFCFLVSFRLDGAHLRSSGFGSCRTRR
jgi:hypothetical protein